MLKYCVLIPQEVCWCQHPHVSISMSIPYPQFGREGNKECFLVPRLVLNTVKGMLRGFSGGRRRSEVENKCKEEMAPGGTNAPSVEHTLVSMSHALARRR